MSAGIVALSGCATYRAEEPLATADGHIAVRPGRAGLVVAAPHGASDIDTGGIVEEIARRTGFGLVVASGFSLPVVERPPTGPRHEVERPPAGVPRGLPSAHEATEAAHRVSELYERRVLKAAQGPLRFYAEILGNGRTACAGRIEIATAGVDRELALRLRALAELIRDAHLRADRDVQPLDVLVEPVDPVTYRASGARRDGILRLPERGLHIELPRCARRDWRDAYTAILADFLAQAVMLTTGPSIRP